MRAENGPFVVRSLGGAEHHGLSGQMVPAPLAVAVVGRDGRPPTDGRGGPVGVSVVWEVVRAPKGADMRGLPGDRSRHTVRADVAGRARVSFRLARPLGLYVVRARVAEYPDAVDAFFKIYTEGVVSTITIFPVRSAVVGGPMRVVVRATDWRGRPVAGASLFAGIEAFDPPSRPLESFRPIRQRRGRYEFAIRCRRAGTWTLTVGDPLVDCVAQTQVQFPPGKPRRLEFRPVENPRKRPPYTQTRIEVRAFDRFGNLTPAPDTVWRTSSGTIEPVAPHPGASAAGLLAFGRKPTAVVTARAGGVSARTTVDLPGVYLRPVESEPFSYACDNFRVWVEVFPPANSGVVRAVRLSLRQPGSAERVAVSQPDPESGVPLPQVIDEKGGVLSLAIERMEVPQPEEGGRLVIAQLEYHCLKPEAACFQVLQGVVTTSSSPDRDHPLHPGTEWCRTQKEENPKTLCLNVCMVTKPGGKTLEQLKTEAQAQVQKAQEIFDANIPECCPQIKIKACYNELKWDEYRPI
ncbi:MAG: hypothetical protein HY660_06430, partial [Armatimonadetes bacterium]|nr:hypothetical protein [Armatimonadota bacterium]